MNTFMLIETLLAGLVLGTAAVAGAPADAEIRAHGRAMAELCVKGEGRKLAGHFNAAMLQAVPQPEVSRLLDSLLAQGAIGPRLSEDVHQVEGQSIYVSVHPWGARKMKIDLVFDGAWKIGGLMFKPTGGVPPAHRAGYKLHSSLRLPFEGDWLVVWGGATVAENYHVPTPEQRHAYDILIEREGRTFRTNGKDNEDYYAFGVPVLAPAAGTVVTTVADVRDNVPGRMNPAQTYGNHVVIDMGHNEYAVLCHFKKGSLMVKVGQKVQGGEPLGLCGNSGNSSEAHIHFHVQDKPAVGAAAIGLPAPFSDFVADGVAVRLGVPVKGTHVRIR